ncbi:small basic protein Sbp [Clostridium aceticum]|uniref:Small basic protein Sbp n=1 Tax=Clostridium aceticum TaxID=84022 RepID=A0A0D8I946_9CLOT|nr:small basic family protein [Clostridium aceticum]AKL95620.1 small basic protein Sbp [Clostridium aceticum]KJF26810.1 small basic protein [Clostridium aceticum]
MLFAIIGLALGIFLGLYLPITYPATYSLYISVAILAAMDSVFGALRASVENKFNTEIFVSGFFGNAILAGFLAYIGDRLGVPLYYAAIFAFGARLFQNFAILRRHLLGKIRF